MPTGRDGGEGKRRRGRSGVAKKAIVTGILFLALMGTFVGLPLATSGPRVDAAVQPPAASGPTVKPQVTWGDYRYTFTNVVPSDDLDPQSTIINDYRGLEGHSSFSSANFVHLYMTIEWPTNLNVEPPGSFTPLQLKLHTNAGTFWLFGKDCISDSFVWRPLVRYPSYPNGPATKIFFTFNTHGASIDCSTAYIEVIGLQQVVDMDLFDLNNSWLRTHFEYQRSGTTLDTLTTMSSFLQPTLDILPNFGTTEYSHTPLENIPLSSIISCPGGIVPTTD